MIIKERIEKMNTEAIKQLATNINNVAEAAFQSGKKQVTVTRQQYQDEVKKYWKGRCDRLQAENEKLLAIIKNALVSLAIINMPCAEDNLANVATNEDLLKIMADSFREAPFLRKEEGKNGQRNDSRISK